MAIMLRRFWQRLKEIKRRMDEEKKLYSAFRHIQKEETPNEEIKKLIKEFVEKNGISADHVEVERAENGKVIVVYTKAVETKKEALRIEDRLRKQIGARDRTGFFMKLVVLPYRYYLEDKAKLSFW